MENMFNNCTSLITVKFFDINVTTNYHNGYISMKNMFTNCISLNQTVNLI